VTSLEFTALPGADYYIVVDCAEGDESTFTLDVDCSSDPGPDPRE